MSSPSIDVLHNIATQLRIDSVRSTSEAGSGHPTTCMSAAEIIAALFFAEMRFDPEDPQHPEADRFVLSKGHAAPLLYAAWAAVGAFPRDDLLKLRKITSDLEGHPTPRLPFVDVATGSLGQGLAAGIGIALNARRIGSDYRTYVLMGDGETAEGSVWEAAEVAAESETRQPVRDHRHERLRPEPADAVAPRHGRARAPLVRVRLAHDRDRRPRPARGPAALAEARATKGQPTMIVARTLKGKGVKHIEGKDGWHGKVLKKGQEMDDAITELEAQYPEDDRPDAGDSEAGASAHRAARRDFVAKLPAPAYKLGDSVATREAYGSALATLGGLDPRVVALDADVKNSTFSEKFEKAHPDRFYEMFIAEQVMIGASMGLASRGAIPFPSTFACFLERAADFIRMAGISNLNVKMAGSHAGISIGEDGPSQMALEDLAMLRGVPNCVVLYPSDGMSAERLVALAAVTHGPVYIRTTRPKTPVIYGPGETFVVGGSKTLRQSDERRRDDRGCRRDVVRGAQGLRRAREGAHRHPRDRRVLGSADRPGRTGQGRACHRTGG